MKKIPQKMNGELLTDPSFSEGLQANFLLCMFENSFWFIYKGIHTEFLPDFVDLLTSHHFTR